MVGGLATELDVVGDVEQLAHHRTGPPRPGRDPVTVEAEVRRGRGRPRSASSRDRPAKDRSVCLDGVIAPAGSPGGLGARVVAAIEEVRRLAPFGLWPGAGRRVRPRLRRTSACTVLWGARCGRMRDRRQFGRPVRPEALRRGVGVHPTADPEPASYDGARNAAVPWSRRPRSSPGEPAPTAIREPAAALLHWSGDARGRSAPPDRPRPARLRGIHDARARCARRRRRSRCTC